MHELIAELKSRFPGLNFKAGSQFCWSPETNEIIYNDSSKAKHDIWSLLHETGHALLKHTTYKADFELIKLEIAAWAKAKEISHKFGIEIDEDHIEDSLDTYRDWLYKRSICPNCTAKCLQQDDYVHYRCFNCHTKWRVSPSRFCRAYRRTKDIPQGSYLKI
jgi:hypothetical protein